MNLPQPPRHHCAPSGFSSTCFLYFCTYAILVPVRMLVGRLNMLRILHDNVSKMIYLMYILWAFSFRPRGNADNNNKNGFLFGIIYCQWCIVLIFNIYQVYWSLQFHCFSLLAAFLFCGSYFFWTISKRKLHLILKSCSLCLNNGVTHALLKGNLVLLEPQHANKND